MKLAPLRQKLRPAYPTRSRSALASWPLRKPASLAAGALIGLLGCGGADPQHDHPQAHVESVADGSEQTEWISVPTQILFEPHSIAIDEDASALLSELADAITRRGADVRRIRVLGHAHSSGIENDPQRISEQRAQAVVDYFVEERGMDASLFLVEGLGDQRPRSPGETIRPALDPLFRGRVELEALVTRAPSPTVD